MIDNRILVTDNNNPGNYSGEVIYNTKSGDVLIWDGNQNEWVACDPTPIIRKHQIMKDLEEDPELMNEVIVELRKRKIEKLKR